MWDDVNLVPLAVAAIGGGGIGAVIREFVDVFLKLRAGVSAREKNRKVDIVQQRDQALQREQLAWEERDREASKRRRLEEHASELRRQLIEAGITPPQYPVLERTLPSAEVRRLINESTNEQKDPS